jgi:hypothetical protein
VPKFPTIPRLSIVIPIGTDRAAFETTLISVLENRPVGCEVLVANDGTYDDPFDLQDEVRFVLGPSQNLVDLVSAAATESRGRFVHVLAAGICATNGWIDAAIEKFEHFDAAVVAPVIRSAESKRIVAAGWHDTVSRLGSAASCGQQRVLPGKPKQVGAYLQASLWRREILVSMAEAFTGRDVVAASYAYEHLIRAAGWRCVQASKSDLLVNGDQLPWDIPSLDRGKTLRAIRSHFHRNSGWGHSVRVAAQAAMVNVTRPHLLAESFGQALATSASIETKRMLRPVAVKPYNEEGMILRLPDRQHPIRSRRAA